MSDLRSKAHKEKRRKKIKEVFLVIIGVLIVLLGFLAWYAWDARFHVNSMEVTGTSFVAKDEVVALAEKNLGEKLWNIIPMKSPLLINTKKLKEDLHNTFPPIDEVNIEILDSVVHIDITERKAKHIFCTNDTICFFMDEMGFVFNPAPQFEGSSYITFKSYNHTAEITGGIQAVSAEALSAIIADIKAFESAGINIQDVSIETQNVMSFFDSHDIKYILTVHDTPEVVTERVRALVKSHPDVTSGGYEYIDMRIDGKIFLKSKES
jgi:hypothetical protein